jgi:hypothetical protein
MVPSMMTLVVDEREPRRWLAVDPESRAIRDSSSAKTEKSGFFGNFPPTRAKGAIYR